MANPTINGATTLPETRQVNSGKPQPTRPMPRGAGGGQGGLGKPGK